jgi:acetoin utilization deacetylase AcuC-like enzyme
MIKRRCLAGETVLDTGDTHACRESYDAALLAAGAVLQAVDGVMKGELSAAFCAVRPPGHHAESEAAMGFCLFNNIAIGARYAQKKYGVERVAILDWDVHHGNGTQEIFYADDSVFYISLHQYPYYPGTGAANETGTGNGEGLTLNCPMAAGSGWKEYEEAFRSKILPALHKFQPHLVMISAGFDAHKDDPLAHIQLTEDSFAEMTNMMMEIASKYCNGKIISVLEGGYDLQALARSVEKHVHALA